MVGVLLSIREDIFASYDKATFEQHLMRHARIVRQETVSRSGRVLYWYQSLA